MIPISLKDTAGDKAKAEAKEASDKQIDLLQKIADNISGGGGAGGGGEGEGTGAAMQQLP